jgi:hypothetical protein
VCVGSVADGTRRAERNVLRDFSVWTPVDRQALVPSRVIEKICSHYIPYAKCVGVNRTDPSLDREPREELGDDDDDKRERLGEDERDDGGDDDGDDENTNSVPRLRPNAPRVPSTITSLHHDDLS